MACINCKKLPQPRECDSCKLIVLDSHIIHCMDYEHECNKCFWTDITWDFNINVDNYTMSEYVFDYYHIKLNDKTYCNKCFNKYSDDIILTRNKYNKVIKELKVKNFYKE